jgi:hypothetical protein
MMYVDLQTLKNIRRLLAGALGILDRLIAQAEEQQRAA